MWYIRTSDPDVVADSYGTSRLGYKEVNEIDPATSYNRYSVWFADDTYAEWKLNGNLFKSTSKDAYIPDSSANLQVAIGSDDYLDSKTSIDRLILHKKIQNPPTVEITSSE